jgi:hypothetical protein
MDGIEELPGFLGIAIGQELHRAFEVGKENRAALEVRILSARYLEV